MNDDCLCDVLWECVGGGGMCGACVADVVA